MAHPWTLLYALLLAHFFIANLAYLALLVVGAAGNRRRSHELRFSDLERLAGSELTVPVSVVIPAHNEEHGVVDCVRSALRSRFPEFEVIVVDDGSTDRTLERLAREFALEPQAIFHPHPLPTRPVRQVYRSRRHPNLWVISKENGGKADACNAGANLARYRYLLVTDADCLFDPQTLLRTVRVVNFAPGEIVAAGGTLRVLNGLTVEDGVVTRRGLPRETVARFQVLEYASAFLANRLGWTELNAVPVISGGFGLWRRDAVVELGGWSTETTHEDIELTQRMHESFRRRKIPYRIVSLPDPVIWTEVPDHWRGLYLQRKRWQRVLFEVVWKYRRTWFNPRYGSAGMLGMPYLLAFEAFGPFVELAAYLLTFGLWAAGRLNFALLLAFLAVSFGLNAIVRLGGLLLDLVYYEDFALRDVLELSVLAAVEFVVFRPVILVARVVAFFEFLRGQRSHERVERRGTAGRARAAA